MKAMGLLNSSRLIFRLALQDLDSHKHRSSFPHQPNIWLVPRQLAHVRSGSIRQKPSARRRASTFFSILTAVICRGHGSVHCVYHYIPALLLHLRTIDGFKHRSLVTNISHRDPNNHLVLTHLIIVGIALGGGFPLMVKKELWIWLSRWNGWFHFAELWYAVFPSFFALYVAKERESSLKSMQLSNGVSNPVDLRLGHLLFDSIPTFIMGTLVVILFTIVPDQFYGQGFLAHGRLQLYLAGYLLVYTYANPENTKGIIKAMHVSL
ncbi:hypothetical protein B0H14DRAFT_2643734 [Mycena olivaceomarginata]|nr:hypothetical protein B0H14DRAFT_2643734 [Mycena olivaceomarginata]